MFLCNERSLLYTDRRHGELSLFAHWHRMPDIGECVLYNGHCIAFWSVSWLKRCRFMCAFLLGTFLCVLVRVTTNGILYQQASRKWVCNDCRNTTIFGKNPENNYMFRPVIVFRDFPKYSCVTTAITHSFSTSFGPHNGDDATQDQQANYDLRKEGHFSFCFFLIQCISLTKRFELRGSVDLWMCLKTRHTVVLLMRKVITTVEYPLFCVRYTAWLCIIPVYWKYQQCFSYDSPVIRAVTLNAREPHRLFAWLAVLHVHCRFSPFGALSSSSCLLLSLVLEISIK
jgi:hypothetical protein